MRRKKIRTWPAITAVSVLAGIAACSGSDSRRQLSLRENPAERPSETAETERLRKMQMVRVLDTSVLDANGQPTQTEIDPAVLDKEVPTACDDQSNSCNSEQGEGNDHCGAAICGIESDLCVAKSFLALTRPQSTSPRIGKYVLLEQTVATNARLATLAARWARTAVYGASSAMKNMMGFTPKSERFANCTTGSATGTPALPILVSNLFSDGYFVAKEAYDVAVENTLAVADEQMSSSNSLELNVSRAMAGGDLSRAAAAHLLVWGDAGLAGFSRGFCTSPELAPDALAALNVLREAAVSPADLNAFRAGSCDLLNGAVAAGGPCSSEGTVRDRLAELYGAADLKAGADVTAFLGLSNDAFKNAAEYLGQEIAAFGRPTTSYLPPKQLSGEAKTTYRRYTATALPPGPVPPEHYAALAAWHANSRGTPDDYLSNSEPGEADHGLAHFIDAAQAAASKFVANRTLLQTDTETQNEAAAPLSLLVAGKERIGFASVFVAKAPDSSAVTVYGFGPEDKLILVAGEEGLRCGVLGSIEGMTCDINTYKTADIGATQWWPDLRGFDKAVMVSWTTLLPNGTYYVLKPKTPNVLPVAGQYEVLTALQVTMNGMDWYSYRPIIPSITKRVAEILEPSKDWCTHSRQSCAGVSLDDRLPLSDELASDSDGVEASWKYYLNRAKEAAALADTLGTDYINAGLQQSQNLEGSELRKEGQLERAEAEIAKFQQICGTNVDPRRVLQLLSTASGQPKSTQATKLAVPVTDFSSVLAEYVDEPNVRRMLDCLDPSGTDPYVSLGSKSLCLWEDSANPNAVCTNGQQGTCPQIKWNDNVDCKTVLGKAVPVGTMVKETIPLKFFDPKEGGASPNACNALRYLRVHASAEEWENNKNELMLGSIFHPTNLKSRIPAIDYLADYGGFSKISVLAKNMGITDESPARYGTGSPWTGPGSGWPCGSAGVQCDNDHQGLFCQTFKCGEVTERTKANYLLQRAAFAASLVLNNEAGFGEYVPIDLAYGGAGHFYSWPDSPVTTRQFWDGRAPVEYNGFQIHVLNVTATDPARTIWIDLQGKVSRDDWASSNHAGAIPDWPNDMKGSVADYFLAGISDYGSPTGQGWFASKLAGGKPTAMTVDITTRRVLPEDFQGGPTHYFQPQSLNDDDFLNGLELLCELSKGGAATAVTLDGVPSTVDDIQRLAQRIGDLANDIRRNASMMVFANVPKGATEALVGESGAGSYPKYGGKVGEIITQLRSSLLSLHDTEPLLANEVAQLGYDAQTLYTSLQQAQISGEIAAIQAQASITQQIASCIAAMSSVSVGSVINSPMSVVAPMATCANSFAQIEYITSVAALQRQSSQNQAQQARTDYSSRFMQRSTNIQTLTTRFQEGVEGMRTALAEFETVRNDARASLARAVYLASFEAAHTAEITNVMGTLYSGKQMRYVEALKNAKLAAQIAKRAIEQRLGMSLATMTEALPLVEPPASWEGTVCSFGGLDYTVLTQAGDAGAIYSNGFIGDYVRKLENTVESYRMKYSFHEGSDVAVISLRDDLMNVRKSCEVPAPNLLYYASSLGRNNRDASEPKGWVHEGCLTVQAGDGSVSEVPNCMDAAATGETLGQGGNPDLAKISAYALRAGLRGTSDAKLVQRLKLPMGRYRFTWYTKSDVNPSPGATSGRVLGTNVVVDAADGGTAGTEQVANTLWWRYSIVFTVTAESEVSVGYAVPGPAPALDAGFAPVGLIVAAPMLERLPDAVQFVKLAPFVDTGDTLTTSVRACEDTDGENFRATQWRRDCMRLCADGYSSECSGAHAQTYCYREASFNLSQRDIQAGKVLNFSGFARGNFNYRIQSIGLNFVGTATRNCTDSSMPSTCYSGGFIPYTIEHNGPLFVRNHLGRDFRAYLFDGRIEHARGVAAERYVTNPLSTSDRELLAPYFRTELQGRPLDGNFVIRVWEEPGVDFEAIKDVQIVLNYKYWTRFN